MNAYFNQNLGSMRRDTSVDEYKKLIDYNSRVDGILSKSAQAAMRQLGEMGSLDFNKNEMILKKYNYNVNDPRVFDELFS